MATQVMNSGHRYELRSLSSKRMRYSIPSHNPRFSDTVAGVVVAVEHQVHSPAKHAKKKKAVQLIKGGFGNSFEEAEFMSMLRDKPSDCGDEDVDKGSERSAESLAVKAVGHYKKVADFELVDAGPLAAGNIPGGRIFHFNYKAKKKGVSDAVVQTFFSEMTITEKDGITVHRNICLGPSDSLPEKADTKGCLYCLSHNIHHFGGISAFRTGRLQFDRTLSSHFSRLRNYIKKGTKKKNFSPKFQHPGVVFFGKEVNSTTTDYATAALHMFNVEQGTNFELVKIGPCEAACVKIGHVKHLNFEAKCKNDPEAPVHTFFAQVIADPTFLFAHFCKCLGPSDSLPYEVELHGCQYCTPLCTSWSPRVRHPPGPGYLIGNDL